MEPLCKIQEYILHTQWSQIDTSSLSICVSILMEANQNKRTRYPVWLLMESTKWHLPIFSTRNQPTNNTHLLHTKQKYKITKARFSFQKKTHERRGRREQGNWSPFTVGT